MMEDRNNQHKMDCQITKTNYKPENIEDKPSNISEVNSDDYKASTGKSNLKFDHINSCVLMTQTDDFQKQLESSLSVIQTTGSVMKNDVPLKSQDSEPVVSGSGAYNKSPAKDHCPLYYGIKSYIHDFYCPPDKDILKTEEFVQGDDFRFLAEPKRKNNCWIRASLWIGINLALLGAITMVVGYMTPPKETIVGHVQGFTILDRWAMAFNNRLLICQLTGIATFLCGSVITICSLMAYSCQPEPRPQTYYVMGATLLPESFVGSHLPDSHQVWGIHSIPTSKTVKGIQPNLFSTHY